MGIAGAGNMGVVLDSLFAPRLAQTYGWQAVFGLALIPAVLVLLIYLFFAKEPPSYGQKRQLSDYLKLLRTTDAHWFCFYYTVSFGGFVGLASSYVIYFKSEYGLTPVRAGDIVAVCTFIGALLRPVGGALADRTGGIRALYFFYGIAALALASGAVLRDYGLNVASFLIASGALGMANGAVFQLLPQRFPREIGIMTGLVGAGGGIGGFYLAYSLGIAKNLTGAYSLGFLVFAALCGLAIVGLSLVKGKWRGTWGSMAEAKI